MVLLFPSGFSELEFKQFLTLNNRKVSNWIIGKTAEC